MEGNPCCTPWFVYMFVGRPKVAEFGSLGAAVSTKLPRRGVRIARGGLDLESKACCGVASSIACLGMIMVKSPGPTC